MKIKANAKINLSLGIVGKCENGYHLIDTVMHSVSLYDLINIEKAETVSVSCDNGKIAPEENIAFAAAKLFFNKCGINGGADIKIEKHIPLSAGLGGGSADAAAVLCGLNKLYNTNLTEEKLCSMAVSLGADVPFFINGGCQRAQGIGEVLSRVKPLENGYILLAKADKKPSTAEMYRQLDQKQTEIPETQKVIDAIEENDLNKLSKNLYNAFETVWGESKLKVSLTALSPLAVALTGSGPTWFALFDNKQKAVLAQSRLLENGISCQLATPQNKALVFE